MTAELLKLSDVPRLLAGLVAQLRAKEPAASAPIATLHVGTVGDIYHICLWAHKALRFYGATFEEALAGAMAWLAQDETALMNATLGLDRDGKIIPLCEDCNAADGTIDIAENPYRTLPPEWICENCNERRADRAAERAMSEPPISPWPQTAEEYRQAKGR